MRRLVSFVIIVFCGQVCLAPQRRRNLKVNNREEAASKYHWGKKFMDMQGIPNILKALENYRAALFCLRSISKAEGVEQDNKSIQDTLEALLQGFNKLLSLSSDWSEVVNELEKILTLYVDSVKILNKTERRLPGLDALELKMDGPFAVLMAKGSESQKKRLKNYGAVISLFHAGMEAEKDHQQSSNDPIVVKSFALYKKALNVVSQTVKVESLVEAQPPSPVVVSIPPVVPKPFAMQAPNQAARISLQRAKMNSAEAQKKTKLRQFEYLSPDAPKRDAIRKLIEGGEFIEALEGYKSIMNRTADDYRLACDCQFMIGEDHLRNDRFSEALTCFIAALTCSMHVPKNEIVELDNLNSAKVFKSFVNTINQICKSSVVNFLFFSKCLVDFLNFYVDNFEILNSGNRRLPGLDGLNLNFLMKCLVETTDETWREITRVHITIIRMFQKEVIPELEKLESMIVETEKNKKMWSGASMSDTFCLFDKAFALVKRIKDQAVLNPELNFALESERKRLKREMDSASSSSQGMGMGSHLEL